MACVFVFIDCGVRGVCQGSGANTLVMIDNQKCRHRYQYNRPRQQVEA